MSLYNRHDFLTRENLIGSWITPKWTTNALRYAEENKPHRIMSLVRPFTMDYCKRQKEGTREERRSKNEILRVFTMETNEFVGQKEKCVLAMN